MIGLVVGVLAAAISLGRILVANPQALSTLVWAEDGLFPLCIKAHGFADCLVDPWAGYLPFLSRTVSVPVSWLPLTSWPLATNLAAAVVVGLGCGAIAWLLRRSGVGLIGSALGALIPVMAPIAGFEAVNAFGSAYMVLLVLATLAVVLPNPTWAMPAILLVAALTIPSSIVLALPVLVLMLRGSISRGRGAAGLAVLLGGLIAQFAVSRSDAGQRGIALSWDSLLAWMQGWGPASLSVVPGLTELDPASGTVQVTAFTAPGWIGIVIVIALAVLGILGCWSRGLAESCGWMLLVGLGLGAIPAVAGYANNRYYVVPISLALIALVAFIDDRLKRAPALAPNLVVGAVGVLLIAAWIPGFAASPFRSTASPEWPTMLSQAQQACRDNPQGTAPITFSPNWPFTELREPTTNVAPCSLLSTP